MKTKLLKWVKDLFKQKQWTLIGNYDFADVDYLVYGRMKKNGVIAWKTTRITKRISANESILNRDCLDLHTRFFALVEQRHPLPKK